jgi:glycine cleavage system transcriptional repressor
MNQHIILSAIGTDRPGIVDEVSAFIFENGGNIEDSRMVNLRGQFAMMVLVGGDERVIGKIRGDIDELSRKSRLHAEVHDAAEAASANAATTTGPDDGIVYRLTATTMDQAGLVHRFAHALRDLHANIESMDTHLISAPVTGAPMFEMEVILRAPEEAPLGKLRERIGQLCDELNVDWQLSAI